MRTFPAFKQVILIVIIVLLIINLASCGKHNSHIHDDVPQTINSKLAIEQWSMVNDSRFEINLTQFEAWDNDSFNCKRDIDIDWSDGFMRTNSKRECIVAIIDSGFDISHPVFDNSNIVNTGRLDMGGNCEHGTGVLSVLCGDNASMRSPLSGTDIRILPIAAINEEKGAQFEAIITAIKFAEAQGANICNLSIESFIDDKNLRETIRNSNMLFCVSAGNNGLDLDKGDVKVYPACYNFDNVITVADIRCDGVLSKQSNYGNLSVDVAAPGTDIVAAFPDNGYEYWSGTSIATPLLTGIAALLYAYSDENFDNYKLKQYVLSAIKYDSYLDNKVKTSSIPSMEVLFQMLQYKNIMGKERRK